MTSDTKTHVDLDAANSGDYPEYWPDDMYSPDHGHFNTTNHATIDLPSNARRAVSDALSYQLDLDSAVLKTGGMIFLWGDEVSDEAFRKISRACEAAEEEYASSGEYREAESAQAAQNRILETEVHAAGEQMVT